MTGSEPPSPHTAVPRDNIRAPRETRKVWIAFLANAAGLLVAAMIRLGRSPDGRPPRAVALTELGGHLSEGQWRWHAERNERSSGSSSEPKPWLSNWKTRGIILTPETPLQPSGLLGPVRVMAGQMKEKDT